jgi:Methyltransferase domain
VEAMRPFVINPLRSTLQHYERELSDTLRYAGYSDIEIAQTVPGDQVSGSLDRVRTALRTVAERLRMSRAVRGRIVIIAWPLFGYLDPLTYLRLARLNQVFIVVHDPTPLRRSFGDSLVSRFIFKVVVARCGIRVLYHTQQAQQVGGRRNGVPGEVVPHPVLMNSMDTGPMPDASSRPVIRVLGQYKPTRSLSALKLIASKFADALTLEICGRGWPHIDGWTVFDGFVPEDQFDVILQTSNCIVIPYDLFFQSGVAVRCLELGVPVVARRHEHIIELFGHDWPGIVDDSTDWPDAIVRALAIDTTAIQARRAAVRSRVLREWSAVLGADSASVRTKRREVLCTGTGVTGRQEPASTRCAILDRSPQPTVADKARTGGKSVVAAECGFSGESGGGFVSLGTRFKKVVRKAVLVYSVRNRRRKADQILAWLEEQDVKDVLLVGTMGDEHAANDDMVNAGIVERRIAANHQVKMSINIEPAITDYPFMIADARAMPFGDDYVDFALANAIIEHVGGEPEQRRMVDEMTRVARTWVITTPNKWFPVESHTSAIFLHWIPSWSKKHEADFTRLLSRRQFRALLPPGAELFGSPWSPTFTARYAPCAPKSRSGPSHPGH